MHSTSAVAGEGFRLDSLAPERRDAMERAMRRMRSPFLFQAYLIARLPIAWIAGMRLKSLSPEACQATMPYRWLSQNPFRSIYFATQAMAAELSTGALALLAVEGTRPAVAMLVVGLEASYSKKASSKVTFTCTEGARLFDAVERAIATGEGQTITVETVGQLADGTEVSRFRITWSFKQRKA
jgi:hypothetical protein